jgi:small subunit ribosomal protein S20
MPKIKAAKKALRSSVKKAAHNLELKERFKLIAKKLNKTSVKNQEKLMSEYFSALDKAAKNHVIHKNKAARLKSRASLKLSKKIVKPETKIAPAKKVAKKKIKSKK